MVVTIQVAFCIGMLYSDKGYQHFRGPCCLHLHFEVNVD